MHPTTSRRRSAVRSPAAALSCAALFAVLFAVLACGPEEVPGPGGPGPIDQTGGAPSTPGGKGGGAGSGASGGSGGGATAGSGGSTATGGKGGAGGTPAANGGAAGGGTGGGKGTDAGATARPGDGGAGPVEPPPGMAPEPGANGLRDPNNVVDKATPIFDESKIQTYDFTIADPNWERTAEQEKYVQGKLTFNGQEYGPIGIRYKGAYTLMTCIQNRCRKSLKVDFSEFNKDLKFHGLKRLNFHVMFNDDAFMRDRLGYGLQREFGVPAPRAAYAKVTINGKSTGIYTVVEAIDGQFVRSRFADGKGNVYKETWPMYTTEDPYKKALKTNEDEMPVVAPMVKFTQAIKASTDANFAQMLGQWMDVDLLAKTIAVDRALHNWDGPLTAWYCFGSPCKNHNVYWYQESQKERVWMLLWDMNDVFKPSVIKQMWKDGLVDWNVPGKSCDQAGIVRVHGGNTAAAPPMCDPFVAKIATVLRPRYVAAQKMLAETLFTKEKMTAKINAMSAQLEPLMMAGEAAASGTDMNKWKEGVRYLRDNALTETMADFQKRIAENR